MQEKLSVRKVYRNAYRYVLSHLFAFAFLTIFYFIGSLPALLFDVAAQPYQAFSLIYMYVFFYFAAGCYFKQQILWDRKIFIPASLRFLMAVALFLFSIFVASLGINVGIFIIKRLFGESGLAITMAVLTSPCWLIIKYLIIFMLFVVFFIVPSFAFVSEITGRSRSLLMTYVKTKGSLLRIAIASFSACVLMLGLMLALMYVNILLASVARAAILAFVSILYFKMYDFFYKNGEGHPNCFDNINSVLEEHRSIINPVNLFMNTTIDTNGKITIHPPVSKAGDKIVLEALMDVCVGIAACSVSESDTNKGKCTPIKVYID